MRCDPVVFRRLLVHGARLCVVFVGAACAGLVSSSLSACLPVPLPDDHEPWVPPVAVPACTGDNDGTITAAELPLVTGVVARYRVGTDVAVDTDGEADDDGVVVWDLSRPDPALQPLATLSAEPMAGQWFADLFPGATVAAPLTPDNAGDDGQLGPVVVDDDGWHLLGAASRVPEPASGTTRIVYDVPTTLYPLPLVVGARVESTSRATDALLLGVPTSLVDETTVEVVRRGRLVLPDLVLDNTLQVTVRLRRTLIAGDVQQVSHHFVHECLGEVARFVSATAPLAATLDDDFSMASEVWRLSL